MNIFLSSYTKYYIIIYMYVIVSLGVLYFKAHDFRFVTYICINVCTYVFET